MLDANNHLADLFGAFKANFTIIAVCIGLTFSWSYFWPSWIKDDEGQKLPPSSLARAAFSLSIILLYLSLLGAAFVLPQLFVSLFPVVVDWLSDYFDLKSSQKHVPFGIIILLMTLYNIPQIKELFERWAYFLHASQYRRSDESELRRHLQTCIFNASEEETEHNKDFVQQFDIYLTDNNMPVIRDETAEHWRKVCTLLRALQADIVSDNSVLSERDRAEVARIEDAHRRKTLLAMNIIRMLDQLATNPDGSSKEQRQIFLTDAAPPDKEGIKQAGQIVERITGREVPQLDRLDEMNRPLLLSSKQFAQYLGQIGGYFLKEYQIMLQDAARLAAKAVVRAGDEATERLESFKRAGFTGLGRIERHSFDGVLGTLLITWAAVVVSFLVMSAAYARREPDAPPPDGGLIFSVATIVSISVILGSIWGANRNLVEKRVTPWSSYLTAGLISVGVYVVVHSLRFLWSPEQALQWMARLNPAARNYGLWQFMAESWPFSLSVLFLVIGICMLARQPCWTWAESSGFRERATDGMLLGLVYATGSLAGMATHILLRTTFGTDLVKNLAAGEFRFFIFVGMMLVLGFIIGYAILRDVRRIGHSHILDKKAAQDARRAQTATYSEKAWAKAGQAALRS